MLFKTIDSAEATHPQQQRSDSRNREAYVWLKHVQS